MKPTEPTTPILFCDANVLYSSLLRDVLLRLARAGLCQLRWSAAVQDEWMRHLLTTRPGKEKAIQRTRMLMEHHFPQANVSGFEYRINGLSLPDPDDCHVLAAAIHAQAHAILTFNLKDFPRETLQSHGLDVIHPDPWLSSVIEQHPAEVLEVLAQLLNSLNNPPLTRLEFCESLERLTLPTSAAKLRGMWAADV